MSHTIRCCHLFVQDAVFTDEGFEPFISVHKKVVQQGNRLMLVHKKGVEQGIDKGSQSEFWKILDSSLTGATRTCGILPGLVRV